MTTDALTELFLEALDKEKTMIDLYTNLSKKIKDKNVLGLLAAINKDEKQHLKNVKGILDILKQKDQLDF